MVVHRFRRAPRTAAPRADPAAPPGGWNQLATWRWSFVATHLALLAFVFLDHVSADRTRLSVFLVLVAIAVRWFWGDRQILMNRESPPLWFLGVSFALAGSLFAAHSIFFFSLFAYFPLCFLVVGDSTRQIGSALFLTGIAVVGIAGWDDWTRRAWTLALVQGLVFSVFAVATGRWIERIISESKERQRLLDDLEAARSELAEAHRQAGVRSERERLAAEIHDTLAQGFASLLLLTRAIRPLVGTAPERAASLLDTAERTAQENLDEARSLVGNLQPVALVERTFTSAIEELGRNFSIETGVACDVSVEDSADSVSVAVQSTLLRTAQESLTNIRRHAHATNASVRVRCDAARNMIVLEVSDNGCGGAEEREGRYGITGVRARAKQLDGTLDIASSAASGTCLTLAVPMEKK